MYDHRRELGRKSYSLLSTRALADRVFWTLHALLTNGLRNVIIFKRFTFHFDVSNFIYNLRFCQQTIYTGSNLQIPRDETGTYNFPSIFAWQRKMIEVLPGTFLPSLSALVQFIFALPQMSYTASLLKHTAFPENVNTIGTEQKKI